MATQANTPRITAVQLLTRRRLLAPFIIGLAVLIVSPQLRRPPRANVTVNGLGSSERSILLRKDDLMEVVPTFAAVRGRFLVQFVLEGSVVVGELMPTGASQTTIRSDSTLEADNYHGRRTVRLVLSASDGWPRLGIMARTAEARITDLSIREVQVLPLQPWNDRRAVLAAVVLAIGTVIIWICHASVSASQYAIIGTALCVLAISVPVFGLAILLLLFGLYRIGRRMQRDRATRVRLLWLSITAIILVCIGWKFMRPVFGLAFHSSLGSLAAPLGALFFVLRLIDTQLRWYRGQETEITFREYVAFALFPATLIAGPMETLKGFREGRLIRIDRSEIAGGVGRILRGLAKKLIIGDFLLFGILYGDHFALYNRTLISGDGWTTVAMLSVAFCFAANDISAYADMAIGLARLHGIRIREDSNWPILATDLRDFWRRWHMSVTQWCMNTLYFPLLLSMRSTFIALWLTMLAMGVWHQLTLLWLLWGTYFTLGLTFVSVMGRISRTPNASGSALLRLPTRIATLVFVISAQAFVQTSDLSIAFQFFRHFWLAPFH